MKTSPLFATAPLTTAVIDIAKWQNRGYSHVFAGWYSRPMRKEVVKQHPELQ